MNVKLTLSYDGTNYSGWQIQPNADSVQERLETALKQVTGQDIKVVGSGRTDAGVHAQGQVANFIIDKENVPAKRYKNAINTFLPPDIRVLDSSRVDDDFNARKSAKKKTYRYSLYVSDVELPLKERYAVRLDKMPDISLMKATAKVMTGEKDFKAFCASGSGAKTTVRTVYNVDIESKGEDIFISVTGGGFLYNMVRIMVGTLVEVGNGRLTTADVEKAFATGERAYNGKTLPAKGLCLLKVEY